MVLNKRIAIYVPGTINVDQQLTEETIKASVENVASKLSKMFGGATSEKTSGYYVTDAGDLICENITIVYAYTDNKTFKQYKNDVINICKELRTEFNQECISLEIDRSLQFI